MKKIFICFILSLSLFLIGCNNVDIKKIDLDYEVYSGGTWGIESQEKTTIARSTNQMYDFVDGYLRKGEEYNNLKNIYNDEFFMNNDLGLVVVTTPAANFKPIITDYNIENNIMNLKIKVIEEKNTEGIDVVCIDVVFIKLDKSLFINELKLAKPNDNPETFIEKWNDDKTKRPELLKWFNNNYDLDTFSLKKVKHYFGHPDYAKSSYDGSIKYYYLLGYNEFINDNDILYFEFDVDGKQIENKMIEKDPIPKPKKIEIKNLGYDTTKFNLDKENEKIAKILKNTHFGFLDSNSIYDFDYDFYIDTVNDETSYIYLIDLDKKLIYSLDPAISSVQRIFGYLSDKDVNYFKEILDGIIPSLDDKLYKFKDLYPKIETINPDKIKIEETNSGINPSSLVKIENYTLNSKVDSLLEIIKNFNLKKIRNDHPYPPGCSINNYIFLNNETEILKISFNDNIIHINNSTYEFIPNHNDNIGNKIKYDYINYRFVGEIEHFITKTLDGKVLKEFNTGLEGLEFENLRNVDNIGHFRGTIEAEFISFEVYSGNIIKLEDKYYQCLNRPVSSYFN